jgi:biotin transporter BioY
MQGQARSLVMADVLLPQKGIVRDIGLVLSFNLIMILSAYMAIRLPFSPVPITGQTLSVLISGVLLGSKKGALSQAVYLVEGGLGLPVFAGGGAGIARLLGPTGGYLLGFVIAAFVVGLLAERGWGRHSLSTIIVLLIGNLTIYVFGLWWLARFVPFEQLLQMGLYPFVLGDLIKLLAAAGMVSLLSRISHKHYTWEK